MEEQHHVSSTSAPTAKKRTSSKILDMVIEAVIVNRHVRGTSVPAIKGFIQHNYPEIDQSKLNSNVKRALLKGLDEHILVRPKASEESTGATGRFKINKDWLSMIDKPKKAKAVNGEATKATKQAAKNTKTTTTKSSKTKNVTGGEGSEEVTDKPKKSKTAPKATISKTAKSKESVAKTILKKKLTPTKTAKGAKGGAKKGKAAEKPVKLIKTATKSVKKTGQIMTPAKKSAKQ